MLAGDWSFMVIDLPPVAVTAAQTGLDGGRTAGSALGEIACGRSRLQYQLAWTADDDWYVGPVGPGRPVTPGAGGRGYGRADLTPLIRCAVDRLRLDLSVDWLVDADQIRVVIGGDGPVVSGTAPADASGPGAGADGSQSDEYEYVMIAVPQQQGLVGGRIRVVSRDGRATRLWEGVLSQKQALLLDTRVTTYYEVDALRPADRSVGRHTKLVVSFARCR